MGVDRALIVALQTLLMSGVRDHRDFPAIVAGEPRYLATAASLDYILMLVTENTGMPIPVEDARLAVREGIARAVDDGLGMLGALVHAKDAPARRFARTGLQTVRTAVDAVALRDDRRMFALITLASDLSV